MARIVSYHAAESRSLCATVAGVVRQGGLVAIPTETYYGLGVNPFDAAALRRLAQVKGRPDDKPILVLIGTREQLETLVTDPSPVAEALMSTFWPGPLTIVFPARTGLPDGLTAGTGTVGVRWTSCAPMAEVLRTVGPLTGTSANRSGTPPLRTADEVDRAMGGEIDLIVDAGATPGGSPSTVVRVVDDGVLVLREGVIEPAALQRMLREQGFHLKSCEM